MFLNSITKLNEYTIKNIHTDEINKRRLYDIGIIPGTKIKMLYVSPSKKIKAYLIRESVIAIRNSDAQFIEVYSD